VVVVERELSWYPGELQIHNFYCGVINDLLDCLTSSTLWYKPLRDFSVHPQTAKESPCAPLFFLVYLFK
jgi:hypothetical protein